MVICHCQFVNDRTINQIAAGGASVHDLTVDEVTAQCGAGGRCGGCRDSIEQLLQLIRGAVVGG